MTNQVFMVGRLVDQPQKDEKGASITIAVSRSYKNEDGIYETDFIPVRIFGGIATNTCEYCRKGDLIGIRGRIESNDKIEVIADKVSFLSTNKDLINREEQ